MRILITGAYGQLGNELSRIIENGSCHIGKIDNIYKNSNLIRTGSQELDITNLRCVITHANLLKPDLIINAAAYTDVDGCETNPEKAFLVNALGSRNLAIAASKINAKLVSISTDYVFSGNSKTPYREYDLPSPLNVYGKTKLLGEEYVREFCSKYFIVRTSWLYGSSGSNFVKWVITRAKENSTLKVVNDQTGNPTNSEDLIYHILKIAQNDEYGIYHCTGNGECSRFELASKIINT
jgi:dTDP-4-dehydrorhamnose reductase